MDAVDKTLQYYNQNADDFILGTIDVDFSDTQDRFLEMLNQGAHILDFGCGSGRDTKYFLQQGFLVDAIDGSAELCKRASEYIGIKVRQMLFQELDETERYDAIWACSSILHLSRKGLKSVINKMMIALKPQGIIYTSFKYGDFEGVRNGRYFTDFTETTFKEFISDVKKIEIKEYWMTGDVRAGREDEKWLNLLLVKTNS